MSKTISFTKSTQKAVMTLLTAAMFTLLCSFTGCEEADPQEIDFIDMKCEIKDFSEDVPKYNPDRKTFLRKAFVLTVTAETSGDPYLGDIANDMNPLKQPVTAIRFITLKDFSDRYPAGSDVSAAFGVVRNCSENIPWHELGNNDAFITYSPIPYHEVNFAIRDYPQPGHHRLRIEYEFRDGHILSAETPEFILE